MYNRLMKKVGFWADDDEPFRCMDLGWDPKERAQVIGYLQSGEQYEAWLGSAYCRAGCVGHFGSQDLTDGVWIWPEGYAHYLEVHAVKPAAAFVRWVLSRA